MPATDTLLGVTGATGRLGGRVARRLAAAGAAQRFLTRDPTRAPNFRSRLCGLQVARGVMDVDEGVTDVDEVAEDR